MKWLIAVALLAGLCAFASAADEVTITTVYPHAGAAISSTNYLRWKYIITTTKKAKTVTLTFGTGWGVNSTIAGTTVCAKSGGSEDTGTITTTVSGQAVTASFANEITGDGTKYVQFDCTTGVVFPTSKTSATTLSSTTDITTAVAAAAAGDNPTVGTTTFSPTKYQPTSTITYSSNSLSTAVTATLVYYSIGTLAQGATNTLALAASGVTFTGSTLTVTSCQVTGSTAVTSGNSAAFSSNTLTITLANSASLALAQDSILTCVVTGLTSPASATSYQRGTLTVAVAGTASDVDSTVSVAAFTNSSGRLVAGLVALVGAALAILL